jgi:hypothetical protein
VLGPFITDRLTPPIFKILTFTYERKKERKKGGKDFGR